MTRSVGETANAILRWSGVVVCAIMVLAWLLSGWYTIQWADGRVHSGGMYWLGLECSEGGLRVRRAIDRQGMSGWFGPNGWKSEPIRGAPPHWKLWFEYRYTPTGTITFWDVFIPCWALLAVGASTTLVLWRRKRRTCPGFCPCGYPRVGLVEDATCPECGRTFAPQPTRAQPATSRIDQI